jgi:predicted DsbA family dithiol-disulfide isomerase
MQAHRLVWLADKHGLATAAEDVLFEAIYERGLNVSDEATLSRLGEELGLAGVSQTTAEDLCAYAHVYKFLLTSSVAIMIVVFNV